MIAAACAKEEKIIKNEIPARPETSEDIDGIAIIKVEDNLADALETASAEGSALTKSEAFNGIASELGISSWERLFPYAGEYEERTRREGLHRWYIVNYDKTLSATKAAQGLSSVSGVTLVEKPHRVKKTSLPNDPDFKWQWDLYNDRSLNLTIKSGRSVLSSNEGCDINVEKLWDYTTGSSNVIVSVVDGGVDLSHPDIAGNCIPAGNGGSWNFIGNNGNLTADGHGTHVAGTIAAVRNNGIGVAGIAGGDYAAGIGGVKILSCQVFEGDDYATDPGFMRAIKYGADNGAVISQNSWGHSYDYDDNGNITEQGLKEAKNDVISAYEKDAIDYFIKYAGCDNAGNQKPDSPMKGGIVIFAAGNDDIPYGVPADYEPVLAVGASGPDWLPAWYSNYGSWVDICAPGGDGYGGGYGNDTDDAGYSRGNIYNLYQTLPSDDYDYTYYGYMLGTSMACPHVSGVAALLVSYFGGAGFTPDELRDMLVKGANSSHVSSSKYIGPALDAWGAFQTGPHSSVAPEKVSEFSLTARKRNIEVSYVLPSDPDESHIYGILCIASEDRNVLLSYTPSSTAEGIFSAVFTPGTAEPGTTLEGRLSGVDYSKTYYVALYAFDRSGNYSPISELKTVTMPDDNAPQVVEVPEGVLIYSTLSSETIYLNSIFTDIDGDELSYSYVFENGMIATAAISGNALRITSRELGFTNIRITASDGYKQASVDVPILVKTQSDPAETYPSPVISELTIRTEESAETHVRLMNSTGKTVYESTSVFSGFNPLSIDLSGLAPGRYGLLIEYNSKTIKKTIVKI